MITFVSKLIAYCPRWLKRTVGYRLMWVIGVHIDVCADYIYAAVRKRFLEPDSFDALPLHGEMRKIPRGPYEPAETYAARLPDWYDAHKHRASAFGLLEQLALYFVPAGYEIELRYPSGMSYTLGVDGSITWALGPADAGADQWAQWTLIIHWASSFAETGVWSDPGVWDDGGIWDSELPATDAAAIRTVPEAWNAAHAQGTIIVMSPGAELWDSPAGIWDDGGTWDVAASQGLAYIYLP